MKRIYSKFLYTLEGGISPLSPGFVDYDQEDGRIVDFGYADDIPEDAEVLDGAVVPGFVNTHCHVELSYMKGLFRRGTGMAGFIDQINELRDVAPLEERLCDISREMDQMWRNGVSAMADISNCDDSFAAKAASPMYTRTFLEVFGTEPEDCDAVMSGVRRLQEKALECGLDAAPTPHACYTMSPELVQASSAAGLESGYLSFHSEETPEEEEMIGKGSGRLWDNRKAAGMSVPPVTGGSSLEYFVDRLAAVKELPIKEHVLLVHEVCMTKEGTELVKKALPGAFVALCPRSNIYIHDALPDVDMLRSSGIPLTIGTDSLSSNDSLDMVAEMYCLQENFPGLSLGELLGWACLNGARFLGKEAVLGSIGIGKKPGLVLVGHISAEGRLTSSSASYRIV
ncbi:MAG: amidohydrolase family protein [Bacteroidales bacterium]|nr:amidohydrolase family protein [Bacteroidales bacterium]